MDSILCTTLWEGLTDLRVKDVARHRYENARNFDELLRIIRVAEQEVQGVRGPKIEEKAEDRRKKTRGHRAVKPRQEMSESDSDSCDNEERSKKKKQRDHETDEVYTKMTAMLKAMQLQQEQVKLAIEQQRKEHAAGMEEIRNARAAMMVSPHDIAAQIPQEPAPRQGAPHKSDDQNGKKSEAKPFTCYNCNGEGHMSRDCKQPCGKCKEEGHTSAKCPKRKWHLSKPRV
ncbi:uncharacterized protein [Ptychodera flava]|uniref:uncharacterized protein n=1 Tax=Ptychodera flava TaxID=63121 RepID=UPI00396A53ED